MFRLDDVYDEAKAIIGNCDDQKLFRWVGDAVSLIANKGDFEGWKGYLDICSRGCSCNGSDSSCTGQDHLGCGSKCITLPREVDTVLAVNIAGMPTLGFGQLFSFHLNGPGDRKQTCEWSWMDQGNWHCTYKDLITPSKLVVHLSNADDNGKEFRVFGYDSKGQVLRQQVNGVWQNGVLIPTIYGLAIPDADAPVVARITGIYKAPSAGSMRLATIDNSGASGVLLGVYEPDETLPQLRRIIVSRACQWVRIAYRRINPIFSSRYDHVPLRSRIALKMGITACKHYSVYQYGEAHAAEADAVRMEVEAQQVAEAPTYSPIQVIDRSNPRDKYDYDIR